MPQETHLIHGQDRMISLKLLSHRSLGLRRHTCAAHMASDAAAKMLDKIDVRQTGTTGYDGRWQDIWKAGVPKGQAWDRSKSSPALVELLSSGRVNASGKRVLVPGCGRGYDVVTFAAVGEASQAVGLEISSSAVEEASCYIKEAIQGDKCNSATVETGNFFTWQHAEGPFDLGYDYTFACAMHPGNRANWAEGWARTLKKGGTLITLIYPVDDSMDANIGPPFPVTPDLYKELLIPAGFELISLEAVAEQQSHEGRQGREYLGLWRRT